MTCSTAACSTARDTIRLWPWPIQSVSGENTMATRELSFVANPSRSTRNQTFVEFLSVATWRSWS